MRPDLERNARGLAVATNWVFFLAGIVNLTVGTWSAWSGSTPIAATCLTAGLVLLLAATIDRFESVKGLGIEAKTRKLEHKLELADEALRNLRELAELTGSAIVEMNSKLGLWDSSPAPKDSLDLVNRVRAILLSLGSDPSIIQSASRPWAVRTTRDLAATVIRPLYDAVQKRLEDLTADLQTLPPSNREESSLLQSRLEACRQYLRRLGLSFGFELADYPEKFVALVADAPLGSSDVEKWVGEARRLEGVMLELREKLTLQNESLWIQALEKDQKLQERGS